MDFVNKVFYKNAGSMKELPDNSIQLIITSPPYFNIKDYSKATTEDFIKNGSIKKRGIENFGEDFSYLMQFVYGVCHPNIKVIGLKNEEPKFRRKIDDWNKDILYILKKETIQKLKEKLYLAKEENAF